ncbi:MAG: hypothetical protein ABIQ88_23820 [Chitinophagaceae bacterium]
MSTSIPAFHVSGISKAKGSGDVFIASRQQAGDSGIFHIEINVHFDPATDNYPAGALSIKSDLSDGIKGTFTASSIELINSFGKHNPTIFLTGQCKSDTFTRAPLHGCRFWVMVASNTNKEGEGTPDIASFCIHDRNGNRIAYGTGPLKGNIEVAPN